MRGGEHWRNRVVFAKMVRASSLVVVLVGSACFSDAPPLSDDTGTTGNSTVADDSTATASGDGTSGTSGGPSTEPPTSTGTNADTSSDDCDDSICTSVPEGWLGPFAVALVERGDEAPDCVGPFGSRHPIPLHVGLPAFDCGCTCVTLGTPPPPCFTEIRKYESTFACDNDPTSMGMNNAAGTCLQVSSDLVLSVSYTAMTKPKVMPSCTVGAMNVPKEPSYWEVDAVLCALDDAIVCDGGLCAPIPSDPFGRLCILGEGDVECPDGYGAGQALFTNADDDRVCTDCACTGEIGDCTPVIHRSVDGTCTDLDDGVSACAEVSDHLATTWYPVLAPGCYPQQTTGGTVSGEGPHTLCCRE